MHVLRVLHQAVFEVYDEIALLYGIEIMPLRTTDLITRMLRMLTTPGRGQIVGGIIIDKPVDRRSYHYRYNGSMNSPGSSSQFLERVAQHAMNMLRQFQSDLPLVDNDFFPSGVKQSSTR